MRPRLVSSRFLAGILLFAGTCAGPVLPHVDAAVLKLDGKLLIKGMPLDGARLIVVSNGKETRTITEHLGRFMLDLELQDRYLMSFERPGCVSKQLLFDTYVPEGHAGTRDFQFPFQVTLDAAMAGQLEYAGPVGYIHFDERSGDFGYSTDYRIAKDPVLTRKLGQAQAELEVARPVAAPTAPVVSVGTTWPSGAGTYAAKAAWSTERVAPTVSRVAPMVHVLEAPAHQAPVAAAGPEVAKEAEAMAMAVGAGVPSGTGPEVHWSHEVQVEPRHVITIITRESEGRKSVYRRVAGYYGGVTYFRNGQPCSAEVYERETGELPAHGR